MSNPLFPNHTIPWFIMLNVSQHILDDIKDYFGERIGLYFLYLQHYVTLLIVPAFLGLITYIGKTKLPVIRLITCTCLYSWYLSSYRQCSVCNAPLSFMYQCENTKIRLKAFWCLISLLSWLFGPRKLLINLLSS